MKIQVPQDDLVGGDWNHGILNDFPDTVGNVIIPTDEFTPSFFRGVGLNHQPDFRLGCSMKIHEKLPSVASGGATALMETSPFFCGYKKPSSYRFFYPSTGLSWKHQIQDGAPVNDSVNRWLKKSG